MVVKIRIILSIVSLLMILTCAYAYGGEAPSPRPWPPPARFDHAFPGKLVIRSLPFQQVLRDCHAMACSYGPPDHSRCFVVVPRPGDFDLVHLNGRVERVRLNRAGIREMIRHERGHCNKWDPDHGP